ncbi:unnamed protein product [Psylliodes chrysocephalus]|uniref:Transmembrane protein 223 n=1 Tax=Psylliodes chrysocephalus TaxID=3402493 RepID=A0A9P0GLC3_9CUCU|nr:unnamed protein product [Psylliodes chrysocephala]
MLKWYNLYKNSFKSWSFFNTFNKYSSPRNYFQRNFSQVLDVNTNVPKDVILYKHDNSRYFKIMNLAGFVQFGFWTYLSITAYTTLKDAPVDHSKATRWWEKLNLGDNKYRNGITFCTGLIGWGVLALTWMYTLRSVKYIILRQGGQLLTIVTYTPITANRMFTLNLKNVSALDTRASAKNHLALKVKGHSFYYLIDMKGEFKNTTLFDHTVAVKRKLNAL